VPPPVGQLPYAQTKPMLPGKDELAEYEHALTTFPEQFEALFQSS
jgi:hypothetical protein